MSGLSSTLWGRTWLGMGVGWAGTLGAPGALGALTVRMGRGPLDLTAVWGLGCTSGRGGGGVVATEHTTERERDTETGRDRRIQIREGKRFKMN